MIKQAVFGRVLLGAGLTVGLGVASAAAELTGTLSRIEGTAVVSQGAQYVKGREGMKLKEGDRLMVLEGGNAVISFADGCRYTLGDNELLTVGAASTCAAAAIGSYKVDPKGAVAQTPNAAADLKPAAVQAGAGGGGAAAPWIPFAVMGGVVIAGVVIAANDDDDNDGRRTISP
jgi:hypothetical protein